jgi:hypothetical protein
VEFGLKLRGVPRQERRAVVDLMLFKVGLFEFDKHFPASCMDLVREETLGFLGRKERPASEAGFAVFLAESADAAV